MANLNEPLTFKHGAVLKNRFVQPPMLTNSGKDGFATDDTINYYAAHSKAGSMIITEYMYVSETGGPALSWQRGNEQLAVYDDKFIPQLTKVAQAMKKDGNKAIMQIANTGREAAGRVALSEKPVYAPTAMDFPFLPYKVHEFNNEQIEQMVQDFADATKRAIKAGFDGVEIHGANHYLIQQFFSAYSNKRTDHWGGSLAKRMNFPLAVVKAVTDVVKKDAPADFIVGYRISPEEINPGSVGYTWHESTQLIKKITDNFDLDYIHLSMTTYNEKPKDSDQTFAELFHPVLGEGTKEIIVGGVNSAAQAKDAMNYADLIAVGHENLIDPLFAQKALAGKENDIVTSLTPEQAKKAHLTGGMIENFSSPAMAGFIAGGDSLRPLHKGEGSWREIHYAADNPELK